MNKKRNSKAPKTRGPQSEPLASSAQSPKSELILSDWFSGHPESEISRPPMPVTPEARSFIDFSWPMTMEYYNPLNAIFLIQCVHLQLLNKRDSWLIRDGLVPLMWFFKTHPEPKGVQSKIYVEESLAAFVPDAWRPVTGTYSLVSTAQGNGTKKILLLGLMAEAFVSVQDLDSQLEKLVQAAGTDLKSLEKFAFIPAKTWGFGAENDHHYPVEFMTTLCRHLGDNIVGLNHRRFESYDSFHGFDVMEINQKFLIADSYTMHFALARGARLLGQKAPTKKSANFVPFSPYHGVSLTEEITVPSVNRNLKRSLENTSEYNELFLRAIKSETHLRLPWPRWFTDWARVSLTKTQQD